MPRLLLVGLLAALLMGVFWGGLVSVALAQKPTEPPTPTSKPTEVPTPTLKPTEASTPTPEPPPTATMPQPSPTTVSATATPESLPTATVPPEPSPSTVSATASLQPLSTATATPLATQLPTNTPTITATATMSPTRAPTSAPATATPTGQPTDTPTAEATETPSGDATPAGADQASPPPATGTGGESSGGGLALWQIGVVAGLVGLVAVVVGIYLGQRLRSREQPVAPVAVRPTQDAGEETDASVPPVLLLDLGQVDLGKVKAQLVSPGQVLDSEQQRRARAQEALVEPLSDREVEVLQLVAQGLSNREIAQRLFISPSTVKVHVRNIYGKLNVGSRTQAVAKARALGILPGA